MAGASAEAAVGVGVEAIGWDVFGGSSEDGGNLSGIFDVIVMDIDESDADTYVVEGFEGL